VTAEIIETVAKDFRLDLPTSSSEERAKTSIKIETGKASSAMRHLYAPVGTAAVSGITLDTPITAEENSYEPDF
jgi:hypothetical protein